MILLSCSSKKIPAHVLKINDMRLIMWDMMKMDEYYIRKTATDTLHKLDKENFKMYEQVFTSYGINKKIFYDSYAYYEANPTLFKELIDSVETLSTKQKTASYLKYAQPK